MLSLVPSGVAICELGVFDGQFSELLLSKEPPHLVLIDLWSGHVVSGDVDGNNIRALTGEQCLSAVRARFAGNDKVELVQAYTSAIRRFPKDYFGLVYIDADHTYSGALSDLRNAYTRVVQGGVIMGHDYEMNMEKAQRTYSFGVRAAVDTFCSIMKLPIVAKGMDGCVSYCIRIDKQDRAYRLLLLSAWSFVASVGAANSSDGRDPYLQMSCSLLSTECWKLHHTNILGWCSRHTFESNAGESLPIRGGYP